MKLKFIGVGGFGSNTNATSSFLLNDSMLFDIGAGVVSQLRKNEVDTSKIKYLFISHFHSDHFSDIAYFIIRRSVIKQYNKLVIVGPKGTKKNTIALLNIMHSNHDDNEFIDIEEKYNIEFVELNNETKVFDDITIEAVEVEHGDADSCNGYIVTGNDLNIAYTGDINVCDAMDYLVGKAMTIVIDASYIESTPQHLGINTITELANKYPDRKFYCVHRNEYEYKNIDNIYFPEDGEKIVD